MSYNPGQIYSSSPAQATPSYYATPPPPPPKPSNSSTPGRGPPLPPPPPGQMHNEPSELEAGTVQPPYYAQQQSAPAAPTIPSVETNWLPEILREKTTTDLHDLLQDSALLSALLSNPDTTHPGIPASEHVVRPFLVANLSLATSLEQTETQLTHKRAQIQSRLLALRALEQQHRSKIAETEEALKQFSPMALYQRLSASVQEQEQLVRGVEESWLDETGVANERELGDFIRRVREVRKVAFLRRERKERWDEGRVGGWR